MRPLPYLPLLLLALLLGSCQDDPKNYFILRTTFTFDGSAEGWQGNFADYPEMQEADYNLSFSLEKLPAPLNTSKDALRISGDNRSDDLFMYVWHKMERLRPNTDYELSLEIQLASNAPSGAVGSGGAPGESVFLKAGGVSQPPTRSVIDGMYVLDLDKGNQGNGGKDMRLLGDIANGTSLDTYTLIQRNTPAPMLVRTDKDGNCWIVIGTDSGFEGTTTLYYNIITVVLKQR